MKKLLIFVFLFSCFANCSKPPLNYHFKGMKFIKQNALKIENKYNIYLYIYSLNTDLEPENFGTNKIHEFYLSFRSSNKITIDEGRKLLIECVEYILALINEDKDIREYLNNFPFTYENLRLYLDFYDEKGERLTDGHLTYCFLHKGKIILCILNEDYYSKEKIKETYEEALKKVKKEKNT